MSVEISIVIPCYMEAQHIQKSVQQLYKVMRGVNRSFEVIFVEDKSTDQTRECILQIQRDFENVRCVFHDRNEGKGRSISDGARIAQGKYIGHIDIDLEVSPAHIPGLILELEKGADIALVKRKVKLNMNPVFLLRDIAGIIHRQLVRRLLRIPHTDIQSGCKFFRREALHSLLEKTESGHWFFDAEIMAHAHHSGFKIKQVPGYYIRNRNKRSTVSLLPDGIRQLQDLIRFSKKLRKNH